MSGTSGRSVKLEMKKKQETEFERCDYSALQRVAEESDSRRMTLDPPDGSSVLCISKQVVVTGNFNDQQKRERDGACDGGGLCSEFVKNNWLACSLLTFLVRLM
jgi:hypothetical protein